MAISYPLTFPTITGVQAVTLRAVNQTALTMSPFTYKQQIYNHSGQRWEAEIQVPRMKYEKAEVWISFLLSLNGMSGTFLMGDPMRKTTRGVLVAHQLLMVQVKLVLQFQLTGVQAT
jgi:hypothetical protein